MSPRRELPFLLLLSLVSLVASPAWGAGPVGVPLTSSGDSSNGAPSFEQQQEYRRILRRLGITKANSNVPKARWIRVAHQKPMGRGSRETIALLKTQASLHHPVLFDAKERRASARDTINTYYNPLKDPNIKLSTDKPYQERVARVYRRLEARLRTELGVSRRSFGARIVVVEGGRGDSFGGMGLRDGSIVIHRQVLDTADQVGQAVAVSRNGRELLKNVRAVLDGRFMAPATLDRRAATRAGDAFLGMVVGHEMVHGLKFHGASGQVNGEAQPLVGIEAPETRAHELVADGGAAELGTRAGYSPFAEAATALYYALAEAKEGFTGPSRGWHPAGLDRYRFVYDYLGRRAAAPRQVYDGKHERRAGAPFMSTSARAEFNALPTPAEVRRVAERMARQKALPKRVFTPADQN